jgi:hypothetical protein
MRVLFWALVFFGIIGVIIVVFVTSILIPQPHPPEKPNIYYRSEKDLIPDTYYCIEVVAEIDYDKVLFAVETLDYRGFGKPFYILFLIKLPQRELACRPPAYYYDRGGQEVWSGNFEGLGGWKTLPLKQGIYVFIIAQTDERTGVVKTRITLSS